MFFGKSFQLRQPRHAAVVIHDFANDAYRPAFSELSKIHCRLGVSGALQYASGAGAQWENVTRLYECLGHGGGVGHHLYGAGTVFGANACGNTGCRINTHLEVRFKSFLIAGHHALDAELAQSIAGGGYTDESAAVLGHEIDGLRCGMLAGHDEVAFIFTILVIYHNDHFAATNVGDDGFD